MASSKGCASRIAVVAVALIVITALGLLLAVWSVRTDWGEKKVQGFVTNIVNDLIHGQMTVGTMQNIELFEPFGVVRAHVTNVRFFDPEDVEVIKVEKAAVEFDAFALMDDEVRFVKAEVEGGVVTLEFDAKDRLRIQTAFTDPSAAFKPFPLDIQLRNMRVKKMQLVVHPKPDQTFWFDELEGTTDVISLGDQKGVEVLFRDFHGTVDKPKPLGVRLELTHAEGKIDGGASKTVDIEYAAELGKMGKASGRFQVHPDDDHPVKLQIKPEGLLAKIAAIGADIGTAFGGNIDVQIMK